MPPSAAPKAETVAPEQHPIRVGDVIFVPRELLADTPVAESVEEAPPPPEVPRHWYGWPILATDGLAYAMIGTAVLAERTVGVTLPIGVASFVLGGPIVHLAHRQWGRAGLSLLARTGLPLAGAVLGAGGCADEGGDDCVSGIVGLAVVGMTVATIVDAGALAYEPTPTPSATPAVSVGARHAWLGASGTF